DDGADQPDQVTRPGDRRFVDPGAVGATRVELDLQRRGATVADDGGAYDCLVGALLDQRRIRRDPMRLQPGQVVDRLDEVGLALAVAPDERGDARLQRHLRRGVRPEVVEREVGYVHY